MKKGLEILLNTYWGSKGWKDGTISNEDFEVAKKEGFMFDYPKYISHDASLKKLNFLLQKINSVDVANAFLYSLSTRKLEYRSILGSYYYAKSIPKHTLNDDKMCCCICNWKGFSNNPNFYELRHGLNVLNFERYKFGGVRHTILEYAIFDIEEFLKLPKVVPTDNDKEILKKILNCVQKLDQNNKVGKLRDVILKEKIFKTNKNEMNVILDILGICGVLSCDEFPCYEDKFVDKHCREPIEHKNDFAYPVNRWRALDGVNYIKFEKIFGYKF